MTNDIVKIVELTLALTQKNIIFVLWSKERLGAHRCFKCCYQLRNEEIVITKKM